jgi:cell wall-associated NlpC family hydrolase
VARKTLCLAAVLAAAALCSAAAAFADGPVFIVVSRSSGPAPRPAARAGGLSDSAPLLSDRLAAQARAVQAALRRQNEEAQAQQVRRQTAALEAPAPVAAPVARLLGTSLSGLTFGPSAVPAGTTTGSQAVAIAEQYLGVPYVWGGDDPTVGFDCSGLTRYVYGQLGIQLTHFAGAQIAEGTPVDPSQLEPGDLVFFEPRFNGPGHVGIYVGGDSFVDAPHTGDVVRISSLSAKAATLGFAGAVRPYA